MGSRGESGARMMANGALRRLRLIKSICDAVQMRRHVHRNHLDINSNRTAVSDAAEAGTTGEQVKQEGEGAAQASGAAAPATAEAPKAELVNRGTHTPVAFDFYASANVARKEPPLPLAVRMEHLLFGAVCHSGPGDTYVT